MKLLKLAGRKVAGMNLYTGAAKALKEGELSVYNEHLVQYINWEKGSDDMVIEVRTVGR